MEDFDIKVKEEKLGSKTVKIAFVGVGGGGCSVLDLIAKSDIANMMKLVAVDEQRADVASRNADVKIKLHKDEPEPWSLRPFMTPDRGREGALEVYDEIKAALMQ